MLNVGTLIAGLKLDKGSFDQDVEGSERRFGDLSTAANATAAAMAAVGAASEGFARSQADSNRVLARAEIATGLASSELREMAFEMSNATFAASDAAIGMEELVRRGFDTEEQFRDILPHLDDFADATGKDFPVAIESANRMLTPFGQSLEDVGDQGDHMVRFINQTDVPLGTLERNLGRIPDELQALEFGLHDASAGIEVFRDRGFSGQEAVREFRRAVADSEGDFGRLLTNLGLSADEWDSYMEAVSPVPGLMQETARANNDAATPLQNLTQVVENLAFRYGGLADALGTISPIMMGGAGAIFALNQAIQAKAALAASSGRAAVAVRGLTASFGPLAVAALVATEAVSNHRRVYDELSAETEGLGFWETTEKLHEQEMGWHIVTDAVKGAANPFRMALEEGAKMRVMFDSWRDSSDEVARVTPELTAEVTELTAAERSARQHMEAATDAANRQELGLLGVSEAAEAAEQEVRTFNDIMREFVGDSMSAEQATSRWYDQLHRLTEGAIEAGGGIDLTTEAGRQNRQATRDATSALWDMIDGQIAQGATIEELLPKIHGEVDALRDVMRQAGLTEDEVDELIATYGLVPEDIVTEIRADDRASSTIGGIIGQLDRLPRSFNIRGNVTGMTAQQLQGIGLREHGGPVSAGQPYIVGEARPEVFVPDVPGNIVPSVGQFERSGAGATTSTGGVHIEHVSIAEGAKPGMLGDLSWELSKAVMSTGG